MDSKELERRGRELRAAFEQTYRRLADDHKLTPGRGTNVSDVVEGFLPTGISFDDAEIILKNAGFIVERNSDLRPAQRGLTGVSAEIRRFAQSFPAVTDLIVILCPKSPGDYTAVSKVSATFFVSLP